MHSLDCHTEVVACAFFQAFFPFCHGEFVERTFLVFQRGEFIFDLKTLVHMSGSKFRWKINKLVYPFSLIFSCRSTEASSKRRYSGTSRKVRPKHVSRLTRCTLRMCAPANDRPAWWELVRIFVVSFELARFSKCQQISFSSANVSRFAFRQQMSANLILVSKRQKMSASP